MLKAVVSLGALATAHGAYCSGVPDPDAPANALPVFTEEPVLVKTVDNGKLYTAGNAALNQTFNVVHVWGSAYEMGYARGELLTDDMQDFYTSVWDYFLDQVEEELTFLPAPVAAKVAEWGLDTALDATYNLTREFTGDYFFEEMQGIADASGVDYDTMVRIHMYPELSKGSCSMFGAWGEATPDGEPLQLRALDWDTDGPFKDHPNVVVYHPDEGHAFANVGFTGWVGSITGMSEQQMAISEIGVSYPDETFGKEKLRGTPFIFLLRDILQFDDTLDAADEHIQTANRTCDLILGAGDGKAESGIVHAYQYSGSVANIQTPDNMMPDNSTWHFRIPDTVYYGMDWLCPGYSEVLGTQLLDFHGNVTTQNAVSDIVARTQTGNLHVALYDLAKNVMTVSYHSRSSDPSSNANAYERQYTQLDMAKLWAEEAP